MQFYAAIAKMDYSNQETVIGLSIANQPETSVKTNHLYIDHMALDQDTMFGTAC